MRCSSGDKGKRNARQPNSSKTHLTPHYVQARDGDARQQRPPVERSVIRHELGQRVGVYRREGGTRPRLEVREKQQRPPGKLSVVPICFPF